MKNTTKIVVVLLVVCWVGACHSQFVPPYCGKQPGLLDVEGYFIPPAQNGSLTLRQVQTFIRHGDRMPASSGTSTTYASCWPNDEAVWDCTLNYDEIPDTDPLAASTEVGRLYRKVYTAGRNVYPGNCMLGQLTQNGYAQQIANGKILRASYVEAVPLLNPTLNNSEVYIRSDDEPRTVQSAHTLVYALFPPTNTTNVAALVDLNTMDVQVDPINPGALCPKLIEVWTEASNTTAYNEHIQNVTLPLIAALEAALGFSPVDPFFAFDCLNTHLCHGYPIPDGVSEDLYNQLYTEAIFETEYLFLYPNTTYLSQLGIGFYLAGFYDSLNEFVNGTNQNTKFVLWSGHDITLMAITTALGFFNNEWPEYASMLNFELYEDTNSSWFVRTIYNGNVTSLPACGYQEYCPYEEFGSFLFSLLPVNPEVSCAASSPETMDSPLFFMTPHRRIEYLIRQRIANAKKILTGQN